MNTLRAFALIALGVIAPLAIIGCNDQNNSDQAAGQYDQVRYVTRGIVEQVPASASDAIDIRVSPMDEFLVHHESIPDFRETFNEADPKGMPSMTMPFPTASGVDLIDIAAGDKVELEFFVFYDSQTGLIRSFETRRVTKLDPDTELRFGNPDTSGAPGGEAEAQDQSADDDTP